jgi:aminoglycoside/choline kinase family phosphotransferase
MKFLSTFQSEKKLKMKQEILLNLFKKYFNEDPDTIIPLPLSGSLRRYFRIQSKKNICIGAFNRDIRENEVFFNFSKGFLKEGPNVPEIYLIHSDRTHYILEDLGDTSFHQIVCESNFEENANQLKSAYRNILKNLVSFQTIDKSKLDFSICVPRDKFDKQSIQWDLNHFKYFFLKISGIPFDEQKLEDDFQKLSGLGDSVDSEFFMFRDFQTRNIMVKEGKYFFIDYQGGRKGPLQYDLASILFEAKTFLPFDWREELMHDYMSILSEKVKYDHKKFEKDYYIFVLIRILQAMGSYGLRGWVEKKVVFLQSITPAIKNIQWLLSNKKLIGGLPELEKILIAISEEKSFHYPKVISGPKLKVEINSFSYRKNLPYDFTGNGGGYIFDCRAIHNPGIYPDLKDFTGKDNVIADFFETKSDMKVFTDEIFAPVSRSISSYIEKDFKHLQLNFGCTGGRHRSVYVAEKIAEKIKANFDVEVSVIHRELKQ